MPKLTEEQKKWKLADDIRTVEAFAELNANKARMKEVSKELEKKTKQIQSTIKQLPKKETGKKK